ncbi:MAG: porin family protein [Rhodanobacter sp.]|nr:MAG: porin family protein [Rhodanobacter sp.]TAM00913.1 MAG: porin family protein [Rhodanobacter sp.]TAM40866.1 MAG: porin family protein [Rhodanobacter sp.]TAN25734.1 MAG: porin family protein [Rhodanobacter sp.]
MKTTILAVALATAGVLAAPSVLAQDSAPAQQGWYVGANAGYAHVSKGVYDGGDIAGGVKGGYRFRLNPKTSLGVEVGYQYLGQVDASGYNGRSSSKLRGTTLGLDLRYNLNPSWYGEVRGGAFYAQGQGFTRGASPQFRDFESVNYYVGAGVGYNINPQWSVGLNYDRYQGRGGDVHLDTDAYTASAEYRF